jgi:hypothetical protein
MENGAEKKVIVTNMMNQDMVEKKWDYIFKEEARKHFCVGVLIGHYFTFTLRQKWFIIYYLQLHYISTLCHNSSLDYSSKFIFFYF